MRPPISKQKKKRIEELKADGLSQSQIAKKLKISQSTVSDYLKSIGYESDRSKTKKATEARREYCAEKRLALIDAGMKKLEEMLPEIDKPSGMRDWFVALGTAIDKRRLEDPQKSGEEDALEKLISAIDSHAEAIVSTQTGGSISKPSEDSPKPALRICEERQD